MAKIIYHCYGGSHSSVTSAGIHLGMLPKGRTASPAELLGVPHYDQYQRVTHGRFRFIGRDMLGNEIFVLGKRTAGPNVTIFIHKIVELFDCEREICPVDTTSPINPLMVIGGFLSRGLNLVTIGRPLVVYGTQIAYPFLVQIANNVLKFAKQEPSYGSCSLNYSERRFVFYICPEGDSVPLLLAGLHLNPGIGDNDLLDWVAGQTFSGKLGTLRYLGKEDGHNLYLLGAGKEPEIMAQILRETRTLMEIPRISLCIAKSQLHSSLFLKAVRKILKYSKSRLFSLLKKKALRNFIEGSRREAYEIRVSLLEGILD